MRKGKGLCSVLALLVLFTLTVSLLTVSAEDGTALQVRPASGTYQVCQEIQVEVWAVNVVDLYGADIELRFDAQLLEVVDANPGAPGVQITPLDDLLSPDFVFFNEADNQAGTVHYAATQLSPSEEVSGTGPLFAFAFRTLEEGVAVVDIQRGDLATRSGELIPVIPAGASYVLGKGQKLFLPLVEVNH